MDDQQAKHIAESGAQALDLGRDIIMRDNDVAKIRLVLSVRGNRVRRRKSENIGWASRPRMLRSARPPFWRQQSQWTGCCLDARGARPIRLTKPGPARRIYRIAPGILQNDAIAQDDVSASVGFAPLSAGLAVLLPLRFGSGGTSNNGWSSSIIMEALSSSACWAGSAVDAASTESADACGRRPVVMRHDGACYSRAVKLDSLLAEFASRLQV